MSPTMVFRKKDGSSGGSFDEKSSSNHDEKGWGDLILVLGGSGGPKIITAVVQVFLNVCFLGVPLFDAVTKPRVHDQLVYHDSVVTTTEKSVLGGGNGNGPTLEVPQRTKNSLLKRSHRLLDIDYTGCVQAIFVDHETNTLSAVSDIRKGGSPAGY